MSNLYNEMAEVYEAMYKTFIDYDEEFNTYKQLLEEYNCHSVLEIGCGTGNLANRFVEAGFEFTGMDISGEMLAIAKKNNPRCEFIQAGMQDFQLKKPKEAAIITGRTISYLLTNKEVFDSLAAIFKNLKPPGILCFDFINASKFIPLINADWVTHKAVSGSKIFQRESLWTINFNQSWTFDWSSVFYEEKPGGDLEKIGEDNSAIRAFTKDEITLFLQLAGFRVDEIIARKSYAFDTFLVIAEKASDTSKHTG